MTDRTHRHHWLRRLFGRARVELARAWDEIYWPGRHPAPETGLGPAPRGWVPGPDLETDSEADPENSGSVREAGTDAEAEEIPWHERANYGNWHYPKDEAEAETAGQEAAIDHALASRDTDADIEQVLADDGLLPDQADEADARISAQSEAEQAAEDAGRRQEQIDREEATIAEGPGDWVRDIAVERVYASGVPAGMSMDEAIENELGVMYEEDNQRVANGERALFAQADPEAGDEARPEPVFDPWEGVQYEPDAEAPGTSLSPAGPWGGPIDGPEAEARYQRQLQAEATYNAPAAESAAAAALADEAEWEARRTGRLAAGAVPATPCPVELRPDGQITGPEYGDPEPEQGPAGEAEAASAEPSYPRWIEEAGTAPVMGDAYYTAPAGSDAHREAYADYHAAIGGVPGLEEFSISDAYEIDNAAELAAERWQAEMEAEGDRIWAAEEEAEAQAGTSTGRVLDRIDQALAEASTETELEIPF